MGNTVARVTIIWFVAAALLGAVSVVLLLYRSGLGPDAGNATLVDVAAYAAIGLSALCVYRGIMVAAREQDAAGRQVDRERDVAERLARWDGLRPKDR